MITNGKMKKKLSFRSSIHHLLLSTENLAITAFCFRSFLNAVREIYLYRTEITAWDFQKSSKGVQQFSCFYYTNNTKLQNIPVEHFFLKGIKIQITCASYQTGFSGFPSSESVVLDYSIARKCGDCSTEKLGIQAHEVSQVRKA